MNSQLIKDWLNDNPKEATLLINEFLTQQHGKTIEEYTKNELSRSNSNQQQQHLSANRKPIDKSNSNHKLKTYEFGSSTTVSLPVLNEPNSKVKISADSLYRVSLYSEVEGSLFDRIAQLSLFFTKAERCAIFFINHDEGTVYSTAYDFVLKMMSSQGNALDIANGKNSTMALAPNNMGSGNSLTSSSIQRLSRKEVLKTNYKSSFFQRVVDTNSGVFIEDLAKEKQLKAILEDEKKLYDSKNLVALPILDSTRNVLGVACFINKLANNGEPVPFTASDELTYTELLNVLGLSISASITYESLKAKEKQAADLAKHNERLYEKATLEAKKNKMLLELASALFGEDDIRELGRKIVSYARELTNADKASVFLLNEDTKELISAVFDTATESQFKIPVSKGIAGYVASKGVTVNLEDAYTDSRFNPELDNQTGYKTKSILCIPIPGPNRIVGVTNLINKLAPDGTVSIFSKEDEHTFQTFSTLCGLALHKNLLLDEIKKKQLQLEINMDLMSYHALSHTDDLTYFFSQMPDPIPMKEITDFNYDCHKFESTDNRLCVITFQMFEDLGFLKEFKLSKEMCMQYILTIRKNYRKVAYHNFCHAVSVTHSVYLLLKHTGLASKYSKLETFSMFLAALSHDIDHRGTNNQFQKSAHTALANYYSTSTMERHHFNHAVNILRSPGHNMFHCLSNEDYKKCLKSLEKSILATDLSNYFANKGKLKSLLDSKTFDFKDSVHLELTRGIVMTCSDLTAMTKPWESSRKTADSVYNEFFYQGDEEKRLGLPISANLMDRNNVHEIPSMQVGFFNAIVTPAFELLNGVLPETHVLLNQVKDNFLKWKQLLDDKVKYEISE